MTDCEGKLVRKVMKYGIRFEGKIYVFPNISEHIGEIISVERASVCTDGTLIGWIRNTEIELKPLVSRK